MEFEAVCVCFIVDDLVLELLNEKERVRRVALGARARFCNYLAACVWGVWADQF